jgi:hypothetical protein
MKHSCSCGHKHLVCDECGANTTREVSSKMSLDGRSVDLCSKPCIERAVAKSTNWQISGDLTTDLLLALRGKFTGQ